MLEIVGGSSVPVTIDDVSTGGIRLRVLDETIPKMRPGATIAMLRLDLHGGGHTVEAIALVLRRAGHDDGGPFFGMEFIQLTPPQYKLIASLLYQDWSVFERFRMGRRHAKNVLAGSLRFLGWSLLYTLRATRLAMTRKKPEEKSAPAEANEPQTAPQPDMTTTMLQPTVQPAAVQPAALESPAAQPAFPQPASARAPTVQPFPQNTPKPEPQVAAAPPVFATVPKLA
jgi:cellulose synthase (UDP-forming)